MANTDGLAEHLRTICGMTALTATIAAPIGRTQLLEMVVKAAAYVIRAGSLLLVDDTTQDLVFEIATSEEVNELKNVRVPLGEGIAGLVALTGQPIAVADAQSDHDMRTKSPS
jgi:signal transduction protein with GAF and PtsI domain